jgi:Zn ribbon nucleic-acid-binding protein
MTADWLDGYGPETPAPAPRRGVTPLTCPKCHSDQLKVRSSDRATSYLQCLDCGHGDGATTWKITRRLRRVIIILDG